MEGLGISTVQFSPWVINYLTFGIDIIEGIIIGVAVVVLLFHFSKI